MHKFDVKDFVNQWQEWQILRPVPKRRTLCPRCKACAAVFLHPDRQSVKPHRREAKNGKEATIGR